ncbi:hypothetical protein [Lutibacter sp.]|uniref:hypothetical protein n=1 Tax=Lutibacter sp. TaxID=1925666 RepID=UPI0025B7C433|nr:hypothetical protein [Lutibacter sp.]MCF6168802.1 hypothetical protein [Lutibacter sp.]
MKYCKYGSLYAAIEHQSNDENEQFALLVLKKEKNEFKIETQKLLESLKEVAETINKDQHLYLIVNNNQVLSKSIQKELSEDKVVQKSFPNIKISDFYYEIVQLEESTYISICRKEYIEKLINDYKQNNINIIGFTLGNNSATHLLSFIEKTNFSTSNTIISIGKNQLKSIDLNDRIDETSYVINGIEISNTYILALASVIAYYTNSTSTSSNFKNYNVSILKYYTQKRFFSLGLKTGLALLFISLLINFLYFDFYNKKIENLTQKTQINQSQKEQLLLLNSELSSKKKLVGDIINSTASKTSLYFDLIGLIVPNTILLGSMKYQPILKNIEEQKKIVLNSQTLFIKGSSSNSKNFSTWIKNLENFDWINSVDIVDYGIGKKTNTMFELRIVLK